MIILFYSNQCQHSKNIITAIQKSTIQNEVKFFCIDGFHHLPSYITHVPTMKIYPSTLLVGDEIVSWLANHKTPDIVEDQIASSSGAYTMLENDDSNISEIDNLYNTRISTPGGQAPGKDGPSTDLSFPATEKLQSSNLDMAFEQMMAEREKDV